LYYFNILEIIQDAKVVMTSGYIPTVNDLQSILSIPVFLVKVYFIMRCSILSALSSPSVWIPLSPNFLMSVRFRSGITVNSELCNSTSLAEELFSYFQRYRLQWLWFF